jgi:2-alkyl-3-oxoalkanoate reductase
MKIAVLGANGFIGGRLVEQCVLEGWAEVRPIVRSFASLARLARFDLDCQIADASDQSALEKVFSGCEAVIHLVLGDPDVILGTLDPVYLAAQQAGVQRIVYMSSASVHGLAPEPGTNEESPLSSNQVLIYNNAKVRAEQRLLALRKQGKVELVMLRPGIVFGPRSRWVSDFVEALPVGRAYLLNEGQGICNSIYVDNLLHAIRLALTSTEADGQAFLVGDREMVTWLDFYRPFAEALGMDLEAIVRLPIPVFERGLRDRLEGVRVSRSFQSAMPIFPTKLKQAVKGALSGWNQGPMPSNWRLRGKSEPQISQEIALLQSCSYKLPSTKAEKLLGYEPPITFSEGCQRSIGWLQFAGYLSP